MIPKQLEDYITRCIDAGYDLQSVRNYLIQSGWDPVTIDTAISKASSGRTTIHISNKALAIIGIVIIISLSSFFLVNKIFEREEQPKFLMDFNINLVTETIEPGEKLLFTSMAANLGQAKSYDVSLHYEITDVQTGKKISSWSETKEVSGLMNNAVSREIPKDTPAGRYRISAVAVYPGNSQAKASAEFSIVRKQATASCDDGIKNQDEEKIDCGGPCNPCANCSDGINNQDEEGIDCGGPCSPCEAEVCAGCNDFNPCTEDICTDSGCSYRPVRPCCGNSICEEDEDSTCSRDCGKEELSPGEVRAKAKALAKDNFVDAATFCDSIEETKIKDLCFQTVAYEVIKPEICDLIKTPTTADLCYMKMIKETQDYTLCESITSSSLKDACDKLRKIETGSAGR